MADASELSQKIFKNMIDICDGIPAEHVVDALTQFTGRVLLVHFGNVDQALKYVPGVAADISASIEGNRAKVAA